MPELNEFEDLVPGQSLTGPELGAYPWENPPDFADPDEAFAFIFNKLAQDDTILMGIVKLLENDVTPDTIADGILLNAFMVGQITPDVSIIMRQPLVDLIRVVGQEADADINEIDVETAALTASLAEEVMEELRGQPEGETPLDEDEQIEEDIARGIMAPPAQTEEEDG